MTTTASYNPLIEDALLKLNLPDDPANLYEPFRYMLDMGGKRMRPVLVLMGCDLFEGNQAHALHSAVAVELFHNFSLVHDDIMDNAPIRRNKPTVHERWNRDIAILTGDVMLVKAYEQFSYLPDTVFSRSFRLFNRTARQICEGQQLDMDFQDRMNLQMNEYMRMIEMKTAVLLGCALQLGSFCGNATEQDGENIFRFGTMLGIAFQVKDDFLDVYGEVEKFGKKPGGDIAANKKTFLYLKCLEAASDADRAEIHAMYEGNRIPEGLKIKRVTELFDKYNMRTEMKKLGEHYLSQAMQALDAVSVPAERKVPLKKMAEELLQRNH